MTKCAEVRKYQNLDTIQHSAELVFKIEAHADTLLGYNPEIETVKEYQDLKKLVMDRLAELYLLQGEEFFDPYTWIDSITAYLNRKLGYFQQGYAVLNKSRVLAVKRHLEDLFKKQDNNILNVHGKDTIRNTLEKAFFPPELFALEQEVTGKYMKLIDKAANFVRLVGSYKADKEIELSKLHSEFQKYISQYVMNVGGISALDESFYLDGLNIVFTYDKVEYNGKWVGFRNGKHLVKNINPDNPEQVYEIDEKVISKNDVVNALANKYIGEFTDMLQNGQIRYLKWKDEASEEDLKKINVILQRVKALKEAGLPAMTPEIQDLKVGKDLYRYILIKDETDKRGVTYNAYLLSRKTGNKTEYYFFYKKGLLANKVRERKEKIGLANQLGLKDGYYKAKSFKRYSKFAKKYKDGKVYISDYDVRDFADFEYIIQPNPNLISKKKSGVKQGISLSEFIVGIDKLLNTIGEEVKSNAEYTQDKLNKLFEYSKETGIVSNKLYNLLLSKFGKEGIRIYNQIEELLNTNIDLYYDEKRDMIYSKNIFFKRKARNYYPQMYESHVLDNMMQNYIEQLEEEKRKAAVVGEEEKVERISELISNLYRMVEERYDKGKRINPIESKNIYTKHRAEWTDPMQRRMDENVLFDYINNIYTGMAKTELMLSLFEWMEDYINTYGNKASFSLIRYAINRIKLAVHDPTYELTLPGTKWLSNNRIASFFQKLGKDVSADDVERFILHIKGNIAGAVLGPMTALGNSMQLSNTAINLGYKAIREARSLLEDETWQEALKRAQVTAVTRYFEQLLNGREGEVSLRDLGWIPAPIIRQIPTPQWIRYANFMVKSRSKFIKEGIPQVDNFLEEFEKRRLEKLSVTLEFINDYETELLNALQRADKRKAAKIKRFIMSLRAEQRRLKEGSKKRQIMELRKALADLIIGINKGLPRHILEKKVENLMGKLTQQKLGRMVSASIGYIPYFKKAEAYLTMTKSEEYMRSVTAIAYAKQLIDSGLITARPGEPIQYHPEVLKAMNRGVDNTMFALNPAGLGEAMTGAMGIVNMFKGYTVNQMLHDWSIVEGMLSQPAHLVVNRLTRAVFVLSAMRFKGMRYNLYAKKVNVLGKSIEVDHEAIRALRFILWRLSVSMFMATFRAIGQLNSVFKMLNLDRTTTFAFLRGAESPLLGVPLRIVIRSLIAAAIVNNTDDDDTWKEIGEITAIWFGMTFLPFIITFPAIALYFGIKQVSQ